MRPRDKKGRFAPETRSLSEKFVQCVQPVPGGCWDWLGTKIKGGYGVISVGPSNTKLAHRVSYEMHVGPIPPGLTIDHLCRNPSCVNPAHLEAVTQRVNNLRGQTITSVNSKKQACVNGHLFDEVNTYMRPSGHRDCKQCIRARGRAYRARRKEGEII